MKSPTVYTAAIVVDDVVVGARMALPQLPDTNAPGIGDWLLEGEDAR